MVALSRKLLCTSIDQKEKKRKETGKYEIGTCIWIIDLPREYSMPRTMVSTIIKNKEAIKKVDVVKEVKVVTEQHSKTLKEVENLLLIWANEKQLVGDSVSEGMIRKKSKLLHADLLKNKLGPSGEIVEVFKVSHSWFDHFKKRTDIHSVVRHGEAVSVSKKAADESVCEIHDFIESEGFIPNQVFNCDETRHFWKKMLSRVYITKEEKVSPGHKPMKNRLTLLLCGNTSGDLKIKPLLFYHSENLSVFKKHNVINIELTCDMEGKQESWIMGQFFTEWINEVFGPSVKTYLLEKDLPLKAFLIMDNVPSYPPGLEDY